MLIIAEGHTTQYGKISLECEPSFSIPILTARHAKGGKRAATDPKFHAAIAKILKDKGLIQSGETRFFLDDENETNPAEKVASYILLYLDGKDILAALLEKAGAKDELRAALANGRSKAELANGRSKAEPATSAGAIALLPPAKN